MVKRLFLPIFVFFTQVGWIHERFRNRKKVFNKYYLSGELHVFKNLKFIFFSEECLEIKLNNKTHLWRNSFFNEVVFSFQPFGVSGFWDWVLKIFTKMRDISFAKKTFWCEFYGGNNPFICFSSSVLYNLLGVGLIIGICLNKENFFFFE